MQEAQAGSHSQPQLLLYSGHDTTIMPLLVMLGEDTLNWPPYCSNIVFELWETPGWLSKSHTVRVLYNRQILPITGQAGDPHVHESVGPVCSGWSGVLSPNINWQFSLCLYVVSHPVTTILLR